MNWHLYSLSTQHLTLRVRRHSRGNPKMCWSQGMTVLLWQIHTRIMKRELIIKCSANIKSISREGKLGILYGHVNRVKKQLIKILKGIETFKNHL